MIAQKKWQLMFSAVEGAGDRSYASVIVLTFGMLTTFSLMWYLWRSHRHIERVERLVSERTASLFEANRSLRTEIIERQKAEEKLRHNAYHDSLTGCLNRRAFSEILQKRFEIAQITGAWHFAVLFIDLDRLKYVNDTFGHEAGDQVIVETADRVQSQIRGEDRLARLGGDEFAILLDHVTALDQATEIGNRILKALRKPFALKNEDFITSGSVGVALAHDVYDHPEDLLRDSDTAMYHAKNAGRNQQAVFNQEMHQRSLRVIRLQTDLTDALYKNQFFLEFQPIFDAQRDCLSGFEALIRWQHPTLGRVSPDDFIQLSEELGLIHDIGAWVMTHALEALQKLHQIPGCQGLFININVSPLQVLKPQLFSVLTSTLERLQIPPSLCQIEITESALGASAEEMAAYLGRLRDFGVKILIDDFGTEHASLNHLTLFPINGLKIDRSFITDMEEDEVKRKLVKNIIVLKDILNLSVTAEGIENVTQKQILKDLKCSYIQGFLCGKPMDLANLHALLQASAQKQAADGAASALFGLCPQT